MHGIDLTAPDGVARLLDHHRARWGGATMTAPTGGEGGSGDQGAGDGGSGGDGQPQGGGQETQQQPLSPTFTQADLDRILGERLSAANKKHADELKAAQELAGKNETEKLTIERDQANAKVGEVTKAAAQRIAQAEAKLAAQQLGAKSDRLKVVIAQADLTDAIDENGDVDDAKVKAAIEKVLTSFPEWKATTHPGSSGGELNGQGQGKPTFTRKQIDDMTDEERQKRLPEINEALADGRIVG